MTPSEAPNGALERTDIEMTGAVDFLIRMGTTEVVNPKDGARSGRVTTPTVILRWTR